jgi:hypothetical protein
MQKQMGPWFACLATTWPCLDGQKDPKSFAQYHRIESLDICMEY